MTISITHQQWMQDTRRGPLTTRSRELKAIDAALFTYETKVGSDAEGSSLEQLYCALIDWTKLKGTGAQDWRTSTRNQVAGQTGAGIVERLFDEVSKERVNREYDAALVFLKPKVAPLYRQTGFGLQRGNFISSGPRPLAAAGWKFHVCAPLDLAAARKAASEVLPILRNLNVWHKIPRNIASMAELYAKPQEVGKFITIYSATPAEARKIATALFSCDWTKGFARDESGKPYDRARVGTITGDVRLSGMENAYCRYGCYSGDRIPGPDPNTSVFDNRDCGWPPWLPGWGEMQRKGLREYPDVYIGGPTLPWDQAVARARAQGNLRMRTAIGLSGA